MAVQDVRIQFTESSWRQIASVFVQQFHEGGIGAAAQGIVSQAQKTTIALADLEKKLKEGRITEDLYLKRRKQILDQDKKTGQQVKKFGEQTKKSAGALEKFWEHLKDPRLFFGIGLVSQGLQVMKQFQVQMEYGVDASRGLFQTMADAYKLGIDPDALAELQATNRQAALAMGGVAQWTGQLQAAEKQMFGFVGDHTKATKLVADTLTTLGMSGIQPTIDVFKSVKDGGMGLTDTFRMIQAQTGATFEEISGMMREFASDEQVRFRLTAAANSQERAAILRSVMERTKELTAMGFTIEQAKNASKALEAIAGKGPKERFKAAARTQALLGAMGIAGGEEAGNIIRLGRRATKEQQARLAQIMGQANKSLAKSTMGSFQEEFAFSRLAQQSGMEEYLGPSSPFNTTLAGIFGAGSENAKNIALIADKSKLITEGTRYTTLIYNFLSNNPLLISGLLAVESIRLLLARMVAKDSVFGGGPGQMKGGKFTRGVGTLAKGAIVAEMAVVGYQIGKGFYEWMDNNDAQWVKDMQSGIITAVGTIPDLIERGLNLLGFGTELGEQRKVHAAKREAYEAAQEKRGGEMRGMSPEMFKEYGQVMQDLSALAAKQNEAAQKQLEELRGLRRDGKEISQEQIDNAEKLIRDNRIREASEAVGATS